MLAALLAALEAAAPVFIPPLFKALADIFAAWLTKQVDTQTAIAQMHQAVTDAGVAMQSFETQLEQQHAAFEAQIAAAKQL